jgi:hypothetical protein
MAIPSQSPNKLPERLSEASVRLFISSSAIARKHIFVIPLLRAGQCAFIHVCVSACKSKITAAETDERDWMEVWCFATQERIGAARDARGHANVGAANLERSSVRAEVFEARARATAMPPWLPIELPGKRISTSVSLSSSAAARAAAPPMPRPWFDRSSTVHSVGRQNTRRKRKTKHVDDRVLLPTWMLFLL